MFLRGSHLLAESAGCYYLLLVLPFLFKCWHVLSSGWGLRAPLLLLLLLL